MNRKVVQTYPPLHIYRREQRHRLSRLIRPFTLYGLTGCALLMVLERGYAPPAGLLYFKLPPMAVLALTLLLFYGFPSLLRARINLIHKANIAVIACAAAAQLLYVYTSSGLSSPAADWALTEEVTAMFGLLLYGYSCRTAAAGIAGISYLAAAAAVVLHGGVQGDIGLYLGFPLLVLLIVLVSARVEERISYSEYRRRRTAERNRARLQEELGREELLVKQLEETRAALEKEIEERKAVERGLERIAAFDELTSVYNRRAGLEVLKEALHYARRNGLYLTVVFLDVDKLKYVNDNHGHNAGDEYLKEVVRTIRTHLRKSDSICRFGGDEFVVILTECRRSKAMEIFSEIEQDLGNREPQWSLDDLSFSYGTVEASPDEQDEDVDRLIALADERMYIHKQRKKRR
jgi:diguanylate cyclase (GGDEF)-like protein